MLELVANLIIGMFVLLLAIPAVFAIGMVIVIPLSLAAAFLGWAAEKAGLDI